MKKISVLVLSLLLISTSLTGCTNEEKKENNDLDKIEVVADYDAEVIIVGAGAAGLAAAIAAIDNGAKSVIVLEKTSTTGGSLNFTSGSMSGAETIIQEIDGIEDTKASYVEDIMENGGDAGDLAMIELYVEEDVESIKWLWDNGLSDNKFNVDRTTGTMSVFAPEHALYSQKRTYKAAADDNTKYSSAVHEVLDVYVNEVENIKFDFATTATKLVANEKGQVTSVIATDKDGQLVRYNSEKGIIMATGGYSGNLDLMGQFVENGSNYLPGGSNGADGYGIYMMQEVGALIDEKVMGYIPTFPMGFGGNNTPGLIRPTYTWKTGGICVNQEGNRFVDETSSDVVLREVSLEKQTNAVQYDIFTDAIIEDLIASRSDMFYSAFYAPEKSLSKFVVEADSIEELAVKIGADPKTLEATISTYNNSVETENTDEFGRQYSQDSINPLYNVAVNKVDGDKFYAVKIEALCVMTLGGVKTNTGMQVLDNDSNPISGLYAAGEVVGGVWGKYASGGTGVMGPVVFGRVAAENMMANVMNEEYTLLPSSNVISIEMFKKDEVEAKVRFDMSTELNDGEYVNVVDGQDGEMTVKTVITNGVIVSVEIVEHNETVSIAQGAFDTIPTSIIEKNDVNLDAVSGATLTSNRILDAVTQALYDATK